MKNAIIGASLEIYEVVYFGIDSTVMTTIKSIGRKSLMGAGSIIFETSQLSCNGWQSCQSYQT